MNDDWEIDYFELRCADLPLNLSMEIILYNFPQGVSTYSFKGGGTITNYITFYCDVTKKIKVNSKEIKGLIKLVLPECTLRRAWKNSQSKISLKDKCKTVKMILTKISNRGGFDISDATEVKG